MMMMERRGEGNERNRRGDRSMQKSKKDEEISDKC
jgi:hypothetical protein